MSDLLPLPWMADGLCHQAGMPDDWYVTNPGRERHDTQQAVALTICAKCPVRETCLEYALDSRDEWGIWGGKTARERKAILRERGPAPIEHGSTRGYYAHKRDGDDPCDECREAHNAYGRERYQATKASDEVAA